MLRLLAKVVDTIRGRSLLIEKKHLCADHLCRGNIVAVVKGNGRKAGRRVHRGDTGGGGGRGRSSSSSSSGCGSSAADAGSIWRVAIGGMYWRTIVVVMVVMNGGR